MNDLEWDEKESSYPCMFGDLQEDAVELPEGWKRLQDQGQDETGD